MIHFLNLEQKSRIQIVINILIIYEKRKTSYPIRLVKLVCGREWPVLSNASKMYGLCGERRKASKSGC